MWKLAFLQDWILALADDSLTFKHPQHTFTWSPSWTEWSWLTLRWLEMIDPRVSINEQDLPGIWQKMCNLAGDCVAAIIIYWHLICQTIIFVFEINLIKTSMPNFPCVLWSSSEISRDLTKRHFCSLKFVGIHLKHLSESFYTGYQFQYMS